MLGGSDKRRRASGWGSGLRLALVLALVLAGAAEAEEPDESPWDAFELEGSAELAYERQENFDLDRGTPDDVDLLPVEVQLGLSFEPGDYFEAFVEGSFNHTISLREEGPNESRPTELLLEQAYGILRHPDLGLSVQVGRQTFEDQRQWLYDAELDAVRLAYRGETLSLELSLARRALVDENLLNSTEEEPVNTYVAYGTYKPAEDITLAAYGLVSDHRNDVSDRPILLGLQSFGTLGDDLDFWIDAAHVRGREDGRDIRGYGADVLGVYRFDAPLSPRVILGTAFASGDSDPDDGTDGAFRQSGLQGNETEVGGLTPLRYYGEAFDPELSNLWVLSAGLGAEPLDGVSVDLIYHYYGQHRAADELRDAAFGAEPTGESRDLGQEIDLVVGIEHLSDFRVRGFFGTFLPGRAFEDGADPALFARIEATWEF